jgi:protein-S-isoprenylcysteine O-methyltransferase Ste14
MTSDESKRQNDPEPTQEPGITLRAVILFVLFALLLPMVMFLTAGTLKWTMAWVYLAIHVFFTIGSRVLAWRKNPGLLRERARSLEAEDTKPWDRLLVVMVGLFVPLIFFLVAGLDFRYEASPEFSMTVQMIALVIVVLGFLWGTWAFVVNAYFSAVVRIQEDRGQTVVQDGPYRYMRHPGYASSLITNLAVPVMLGTLWALLPAIVIIIVLVIRTSKEDRTLQEELPGYKEYAQRTRCRLIPGIW